MVKMRGDSKRITATLSNGYRLVAEFNRDPQYKSELLIGILDPDGVWHQDLAIVRNRYGYSPNGQLEWKEDEFEILVFGNENNEDYTEEFKVGLYREEFN